MGSVITAGRHKTNGSMQHTTAGALQIHMNAVSKTRVNMQIRHYSGSVLCLHLAEYIVISCCDTMAKSYRRQ